MERITMATVTFDGASRFYAGTEKPAVDQLDLEVEDVEFLVLVGPSGCGKSTTLRMLAGLEGVDEGAIRIGEREVTDLPPKDRDIAMVFQNYALYPHMTVADNIGFHLKIKKIAKAERMERVREAAKLLDLEPYLDRKPAKLSGGQRQRVAMGRAIVRDPHPDRFAAAPSRRHHDLRHARPGRGHDHGRPGGGAEGRHPAAVRHAHRPVRQAEEPVRRRLHRFAGHEPDPGHRQR
jgi:ABC-type uncharacterized transport system YnjBCD ATPase subunit